MTAITNAVEEAIYDAFDDKLRCFNCLSKTPMQLAAVQCELITTLDEFGVPTDDNFTTSRPFWKCENDETHIGADTPIYPVPLKRSFYKLLAPKGGIYKQVAEKGYPWRCHVCDGKLQLKF